MRLICGTHRFKFQTAKLIERVFILALCTQTHLPPSPPAQLYWACSMVVRDLKSFLHGNSKIDNNQKFSECKVQTPFKRRWSGKFQPTPWASDCLFYNTTEISCNDPLSRRTRQHYPTLYTWPRLAWSLEGGSIAHRNPYTNNL